MITPKKFFKINVSNNIIVSFSLCYLRQGCPVYLEYPEFSSTLLMYNHTAR